jgi:hypothetical protein
MVRGTSEGKIDFKALSELAKKTSEGNIIGTMVNDIIAISPNERTFGEKKLLRIALMSPYVSRETLDSAKAAEMARGKAGNHRVLRMISSQTLMAIRREETAIAYQDS